MSFKAYQWPPKDQKAVGGEWIRYRTRLTGEEASQVGPPERGSGLFRLPQIAKLLGVDQSLPESAAVAETTCLLEQRASELAGELNDGRPCIAEIVLPPWNDDSCTDRLTTFALYGMARRHCFVYRGRFNWSNLQHPQYKKGVPGGRTSSWQWNVAVWKGNTA